MLYYTAHTHRSMWLFCDFFRSGVVPLSDVYVSISFLSATREWKCRQVGWDAGIWLVCVCVHSRLSRWMNVQWIHFSPSKCPLLLGPALLPRTVISWSHQFDSNPAEQMLFSFLWSFCWRSCRRLGVFFVDFFLFWSVSQSTAFVGVMDFKCT